MKRLLISAAVFFLASVASAQLPPVDATKRPVCTDGKPWTIWLLNESTNTDCDTTAGGSSEAFCCCEDGAVAACSSGGGGGSGTVTSAAMSVPTGFTISGSPITTSGTFTLGLSTETANTVWAGPTTGSAAAPTFRALVAADLPAHLIFDIGDDGGNDSTALAEISTLNDDYSAMTEPSADEAQIDFSKIPPYRQYDPNRPPSTCGTGGVCDEFTGGVTMTFNGWQNQESSTATAERDGLTLYHPTDATGIAVYWFTGPAGSSTDWTFHVRITTGGFSQYNRTGIAILASGTEASPTLIYELSVGRSPNAQTYFARSCTSYTSANTLVGTDVWGPDDAFLEMSYVSSTKVLSFLTSGDGYLYRPHGSVTLGAHPTTSFGLLITSTNSSFPVYGFYHFVRVRTDTDRANPGE